MFGPAACGGGVHNIAGVIMLRQTSCRKNKIKETFALRRAAELISFEFFIKRFLLCVSL
jgi:hypothetical protein